jgi:hypothetical protein
MPRQILNQEDQWPDRVAANKIAYGEPGSFYDGEEVRKKDQHHVLPNVPVSKVQGLYGEDEDDPYDVYATPSGHGEQSWDVISEAPKRNKHL